MYALLRLVWLAAAAATLVAGNKGGNESEFDPNSYPQRVAHCESSTIHYVDANPQGARTLLLVHGWPGLWTNWARQLAFFERDARFRVIVPDQRGFGASTSSSTEKPTFHALARDLVCVLRDAGVSQAVCVGHDWGSQVCAEALRGNPDVFIGASSTVPYIPAAGPFVPIEHIAKQLERLTYQVYFERETDAAATELGVDVRRTLRAVYRDAAHPPPAAFLTSAHDFLNAYNAEKLDECISFLSKKEEDFLVQAYEKSGFRDSLQFYTYPFRFESHEYSSTTGRKIIDQPTALIYPDDDPVADWLQAAELLHTRKFMPNLSVYKVHAAHWLQLENPQAFNEALLAWLETFPPVETVEVTGEAQPAPIAEEPVLEPLLHEEL